MQRILCAMDISHIFLGLSCTVMNMVKRISEMHLKKPNNSDLPTLVIILDICVFGSLPYFKIRRKKFISFSYFALSRPSLLTVPPSTTQCWGLLKPKMAKFVLTQLDLGIKTAKMAKNVLTQLDLGINMAKKWPNLSQHNPM